jgi:hypothetical protein
LHPQIFIFYFHLFTSPPHRGEIFLALRRYAPIKLQRSDIFSLSTLSPTQTINLPYFEKTASSTFNFSLSTFHFSLISLREWSWSPESSSLL